MIFKQYELVLRGIKTETRRFRPPVHAKVGNTVAVVPRRAAPAWWFAYKGLPALVRYPIPFVTQQTTEQVTREQANRWLRDHHWHRAAITFLETWEEPVQALTPAGARREGVHTVEEYAALWDSINHEAGKRWDDNPVITVVRFRVPDDVAAVASRWFEAMDLSQPVSQAYTDIPIIVSNVS
jgi:hypothetical protein